MLSFGRRVNDNCRRSRLMIVNIRSLSTGWRFGYARPATYFFAQVVEFGFAVRRRLIDVVVNDPEL